MAFSNDAARNTRESSLDTAADLPRRTPGASGYQRFMTGDLLDVPPALPILAVPVADPNEPELWSRIERALPKYAQRA